MDIFANQWVVGIGGGILSGLLVTIITRKYFVSKDDREYFQKAKLANNEIMYAIKPSIVDGEVPEVLVIQSLQVATARKYTFDLKDIASISEIIENLTKEIMDSSFISNATKKEYCEKLLKLKPSKSEEEELKKHKSQAILEYRRRALSAFSLILGLFSGLLTAYVGYMASSSESVVFTNVQFLLPSVIALAMAYFLVTFLKIAKNSNYNDDDKNT